MKILETQSAVLSNYEVCTHILSLPSRPQTTTPKSQNYETVIKELSTYLSPPTSTTTTATTHPSPLPPYASPTHYTPQRIASLISILKKKYNLTKAEALTVVNLRPTELSVLNAIVEECDGRFGEEAQEGILRDVEGGLGGGDEGGGGEGVNGVAGGEGGGGGNGLGEQGVMDGGEEGRAGGVVGGKGEEGNGDVEMGGEQG